MEERYITPSVITNDKEWKIYLLERIEERELYEHRLANRTKPLKNLEARDVMRSEIRWRAHIIQLFRKSHKKYENPEYEESRNIISDDEKWKRYLYQRMEKLKEHKQVFT